MLRWIGRKYMEMQEVREENRKNGEMGFTLIELLVVVIIIGILAAIAIPTFLSQRKNAYEAQTKSDIRNAVTNAESFATTKGGPYTVAGAGGYTLATSDVTGGNADKNTTLAVSAVTATTYKIQGTNKTDGTVVFCYSKANDSIAAGACT